MLTKLVFVNIPQLFKFLCNYPLKTDLQIFSKKYFLYIRITRKFAFKKQEKIKHTINSP